MGEDPPPAMANQLDLALKNAARPQDWSTRIGSAIVSSGVIGCGVGAVQAFWMDVPAVKKEASLPALRATAGVVARNGALFAAIGGTFAFGEHIARTTRGK